MFHTTTDLMTHQAAAVAKLSPPRVGALFMDMGTGKSRTVLELAKIRQEKWSTLFWFCPCALRDTVLAEILKHTDIPREAIHVWDAKGLRKGSKDHLVHIIGIETMSSSDRAALAFAFLVSENSYVIVDESSYIKGNRAKRTQRITKMSEKCRYRTIMTGTPLTQGITDLFSQMYFLSPKILGHHSWYGFARHHIEYETRPSRFNPNVRIRTGRILRTFNKDLLAQQIEPYVYQVRKDECLDLPEKIYLDRYCSLTGEQSDMYEAAKAEALANFDPDAWGPTHLLRLFTDLQKIVCGFHGTGDNFRRIHNDRLDLMLEVISELSPDEPVIIWSKYLEASRMIVERLRSDFGAGSTWEFSGNVPERHRSGQLDGWRRKGRFLVATQSMGGHGLTLNEAAYSIFYANSFKYAERLQAEDRNHRIGQTQKAVYISLGCHGSIDERIAQVLATKGDTLEAFMAMVDGLKDKKQPEKIVEMLRAL